LYVSVDEAFVGYSLPGFLSPRDDSRTIYLQYTPPSGLGMAAMSRKSQRCSILGWTSQHPNQDTLRVYRVQESADTWSFSDVAINSWPSTAVHTFLPVRMDRNWLNFGFPRAGAIGATRRTEDEYGLPGLLGEGEGFPIPTYRWFR